MARGTRSISFTWTGNLPPDMGLERDVLTNVFRRHPALHSLKFDDWGVWLSQPNRRGILTFDWDGPEPDWGALTSIYEVAAAQKGSRIVWEGRASGAPPTLPTVSTPAGSAPVPSPTGAPSPMVFQTVPTSGAGPALGRSPLDALAKALAGGGGSGGGTTGPTLPKLNPWLLAALVLLGVGVVAAASKR